MALVSCGLAWSWTARAAQPASQSLIVTGTSLTGRFGSGEGVEASVTPLRLRYDRFPDPSRGGMYFGGSVYNDLVAYTIDNTQKTGVRQAFGVQAGTSASIWRGRWDVTGSVEWLPWCRMIVGSSETSVVNGRSVEIATLSEMRGSAGLEFHGTLQTSVKGWKLTRGSSIRYGLEAAYIRQPFTTKKDRVAVGDQDLRPNVSSSEASVELALTGVLAGVFMGFRF